jgi:hypothetical protein
MIQVIRLAIRRLAEIENVSPPPARNKAWPILNVRSDLKNMVAGRATSAGHHDRQLWIKQPAYGPGIPWPFRSPRPIWQAGPESGSLRCADESTHDCPRLS